MQENLYVDTRKRNCLS